MKTLNRYFSRMAIKNSIRFVILSICLLLSYSVMAQTLNVEVGQVKYMFPATSTSDMVYQDGKTLTIMDKEFTIADITSMSVDYTAVASSTVQIQYSATSASVVVAGDIAKYLTFDVSNADVVVSQDESLATEIAYDLSGTSTNGSFVLNGKYKATLKLTNLTLTSTTTAPISIANGKRINVELNGTNTLTDCANGSQKACFFVKGHPEFSGSGTLVLYGKTKHAYKSNEYTQLKKKFTGSIIVKSAVGDGMHIGQYLEMNNGTIQISGVGDDGIQVEANAEGDELDGQAIINGGTIDISVTADAAKGLKADSLMTIAGGNITISATGGAVYESATQTATAKVSASACIKANGILNITDGTINLKATNGGGKGISGDDIINISGGEITISTTGGLAVYSSNKINNNYTSNADRISTNLKSSPKGIKGDSDINISGGMISVTTTGNGGEGIESKATLTISGGTIESYTYDDAINSTNNIYIKGGTVYARATNNDAIDSNASIFISGGTVIAYSNTTPETAIDVDSPGYLQITGGTVVAIGLSSNMTPYPKNTSTQPTIFYSGSLSQVNYVLTDASKNPIVAFLPEVYEGSSSGGGGWGWAPAVDTAGPGGGGPGGGGGHGGSSGMSIMITSPQLTKGASYTLYSGATVSGDTFHGLYTDPNVSNTGTSLGTVSSLALPYSSIGSSSGGGGWNW